MKILLLSTGGGGGNILRSVRALFERDLTVTARTDPAYAERVRAAIATRFLDTNEFSLADVAVEERLLIGARVTGHLGARHDPEVARLALDESEDDVKALMSPYAVVILIGTGGKGTGAGTIFPLAQMARQQNKLVLPIFVRPSFERHEVDKRRYDHALAVSQQFDAARIRLVEILNDRGYDDQDPQPQSVVWERMNLPIARALRGLVYVLWDLSQVDPSDLSTLFAGPGRLRVGFGEIDPADGREPTDDEVQQAVRNCWANAYSAFSKPVGTSLVCIHGEWSNVADARIKGGLAASASAGATASPYNPLYTRAVHSPRPWGVTALFGEYTGAHVPIDVRWSPERPQVVALASGSSGRDEALAALAATVAPAPIVDEPLPQAGKDDEGGGPAAAPSFETFWEFAVAVNRSEPAALVIARDGASTAIPIEGLEVRKLLGTMWFRTVVPRLSQQWQARILDVFVDGVVVPNHVVKAGRHAMRLGDLPYSQLQALVGTSHVPDTMTADLDLLVTIGRLWGQEAVARVRFCDAPPQSTPSRFAGLLNAMRG